MYCTIYNMMYTLIDIVQYCVLLCVTTTHLGLTINGRAYRIKDSILCRKPEQMEPDGRPLVPAARLGETINTMRVYTIIAIYAVYKRARNPRRNARRARSGPSSCIPPEVSGDADVFLKVIHRPHQSRVGDMMILNKTSLNDPTLERIVIHADAVAYKVKLVDHWDRTERQKWCAIPMWPSV